MSKQVKESAEMVFSVIHCLLDLYFTWVFT